VAQPAVREVIAMRRDHKVRFRRQEEIKSVAERARTLGDERTRAGFRITNYLRKLATQELLKTGLLHIRSFSAVADEAPAYVTYNPTTLHVDHGIWQEADEDVPAARFILAHELGHVILHDHYAQPFSGEKQRWISREEESAEWQANTFADFFLISDAEIQNHITPSDIAIFCGVEKEVALRRSAPIPYVGECCGWCGAAMIRRGTTEKCENCRSTRCC
jgi:Zn-dependent peptidase ImmA (M78 family)